MPIGDLAPEISVLLCAVAIVLGSAFFVLIITVAILQAVP